MNYERLLFFKSNPMMKEFIFEIPKEDKLINLIKLSESYVYTSLQNFDKFLSTISIKYDNPLEVFSLFSIIRKDFNHQQQDQTFFKTNEKGYCQSLFVFLQSISNSLDMFIVIGQVIDLFIDFFPSYGSKNNFFFQYIQSFLSDIIPYIQEDLRAKYLFLRIIRLLVEIIRSIPANQIDQIKIEIEKNSLLVTIVEHLDMEECLEFFHLIFQKSYLSDLVFNNYFPLQLFVMTLFILLKTSQNQTSWNCIIFILRKIYKHSCYLAKQGLPNYNIPKLKLPFNVLQPALEPELYANCLKLCGSDEELFNETIKQIFFHITSTDLLHENRSTLNYYLIKHQKMLINNIYNIFKDEEDLYQFLIYISLINHEEQLFNVKESYSIIFLILFVEVVQPKISLDQAETWSHSVILAMFCVDPHLNNCELIIHVLSFHIQADTNSSIYSLLPMILMRVLMKMKECFINFP